MTIADERFSDGSEYEVERDDGKTLEETLDSIFTELGLEKQIKDGVSHLNERLESVEGTYHCQ